MKFDGATEPLSGYNQGIEHEHEHEHEHRDAEHAHLEEPGQCDADEGLDRQLLICVESFLGLAGTALRPPRLNLPAYPFDIQCCIVFLYWLGS